MYIIKHTLLPSEILNEIFQLLPKQALFACLCVCKSWFHPAAQIYYSRLRIRDSEKSGDVGKIVQFLESVPDLAVGYKIKSIQIDGQQQIRGRLISGTPATEQELKTLLEQCPNVQELIFNINSVYWKHLHDMGESISNAIRPRRIYTVGKQRCYEEAYFYKVAHQFRSSLNELSIHCSCDASIHENFGSLYSYLAAFPLLQALAIKSGSQRYMIYFDRLLDTCPNLKKLDFQLDHPFFDQYNDLQVWSEYPSMQEIDIYLPNFAVNQLQYITQRFINLKRFSLRINQNDNQQKILWRNQETRHFESVIQFFKHDFINFVTNLDSLHLYFNIHGRSYIEDLLELFYLPILIRRHNRNSFIDAIFEVHHGRTERTQIELTTEEKEQRQLIYYTFVRDFSISDVELDQEQVESTQRLPYITHLSSYGQHLRSLHITITAQTKHRDAADIELLLRLCPNLQELVMVVDLSPILYFSHDASLMHHQHPPTCHWNYNPYVALKSKLSTLTLKGLTISSELLHAIAIHHPHLKNLTFNNCLSEPSDTCLPVHENMLFFKYDLSNLHLTSFTFDIFTHRCGKKLIGPMVCIVVENDTQGSSYYLAKQRKEPTTGELFQDITSLQYQAFVSDTKLDLTVLWFKVKFIDQLILHAGRNPSFVKNIRF